MTSSAKGSNNRAQESEDIRKATLNLLQDIEKERSEVMLAKAKEDALLASIGDGVIGTDREGGITVMNMAAKKMLSLAAEEVMGKDLYELITIEDEKGVVSLRDKGLVSIVLQTGKPVVINSTSYVSKSGKKIPVAINITPIVSRGKIIGTVNVFRDITEEKALVSAKDEFISLASHQLQSPITAVLWSMERLLNEHMGPLNKEQKETIEEIYARGKDMAELVSGFMEVTKMESTGFAIKKEEVDLFEICDSLLKELESRIAEKKTIIIKKYGSSVPCLNIGKKAAMIIFQNLLTNAIKYTPPGGTVEVGITKTADRVLISVKDNGYGIPEAAKSRIFSKLFRADNVREKEPTGTGLGLYLLKSLVDKIGGKVWFESKEGEGSTFSVELK